MERTKSRIKALPADSTICGGKNLPTGLISGSGSRPRETTMGRNRHFLSLLAAFILLGGGCPLGTTPEDTAPDTTSSTSSSGDSTTSDAGSTDATGDFEDQLSDQFPGCSEPEEGGDWRDEILRLVNVERARVGVSPVTHCQTLEDQATQYCCEMIYYDFFAHENPVTGTDLAERAEEFGYDYLAIGENLAAGQSSPAQAMANWMASDGHRENILNPQFTELGVGVRTGGEFQTYWVQEFGHPYLP
jgi:uncharacterized protein YkwD